MSQVSGLGQVMNNIDLGPSGSLQFQFAKLQLALSEMAKTGAMNYIDQIQKSQDEQKKVSEMLQQARELQADAPNKSNKLTEMPAEMVQYMKDNGLAYDHTGNDNFHNKDQWEVAIQSLKAHLDTLGTNTQQLMVFVQDYMGQYNSYLQGANSVIQQANQTLAELARAR
jgi:septation ring formation regulator EzrA